MKDLDNSQKYYCGVKEVLLRIKKKYYCGLKEVLLRIKKKYYCGLKEVLLRIKNRGVFALTHSPQARASYLNLISP